MPDSDAAPHGLHALAAAREAPATLLAVERPGVGALLAARGDAGDGSAPDLDTSFRIASCTKSFTAARVLQLRDAGLLDLDDPIDRHLPVAPLLIGDGHPVITVRAAMSMSAGLPTDDAWADRQESMAPGLLDALGADGVRLVRTPGSGYEYANLGFAWLGRVCEHLDGRPFAEQVRDELVLPLGLGEVTFSEPRTGRVATGYARVGGEWSAQPVSGPGAFSAIGGIFASGAALLRWSRWLLEACGHAVGRDDRVLSAASRREMQRPQTLISSAGTGASAAYGFGLVIEADERLGTVVSHSGGYPGFSAHMRWHPVSGIAAVGFENARYSGVSMIVTQALAEAVGAAQTAAEPWPETQSAVRAVTALLASGGGDDWLRFLERECDPVVALDDSADDRRLRAAALVGDGARSAPPTFPTAASAEWQVEGAAGSARVVLELSPLEPPRIQRLEISAASVTP
ncbi:MULTISPECIES: serine hydrolase [unclassified Leucobacter]|uniref:serine hydrolase domain-containing protein n=1 Tax=unclassified Leucobacter TaxID=2621730 RepID=UPI00165E2C27|nr:MULTISPECIES: serine hydrolase domain-containing protein [unclassified Leucobacter]MBC9928370.1 beta-lactamase family protein [Leucobacter sp. cx-169]